GSNLPPEIVASAENGTGALTFHFTSDSSAQGAGWAADLSCLSPMEHDLMGTSVTGPANIEIGTTVDYTVTITNAGLNPETGSDYTVGLFDGNNTMIGTAAGINIAAGESQSYVFPWAPTFPGPTFLYGKVNLTGDQNPLNDETPHFNVTVMPSGQVDLVIGTGTEAIMAPTPINGWFGYSFSQTLYLQSEINIANKRIFQIGYQYAGQNPDLDFNIEVWIAHTTLTELTASVPLSGFTKVYDGPYIVHAGEPWSPISIDGFYYNNTDNLLVTVIEKKPGYSASNDQFLSTINALPQNMCVGAENDQTPYDPNNLPAGNQFPNRANIKLWFGDMPTEPAVRTTPASLDFGAVEAVIGKIMNVEVMNIGGGTLELTGATLTNDHYSLLNTTFPISLGIGEKHIFEVRFMPTLPESEPGVLTFLMDESIPGTKTVQLSGVGLRYGVLREGFEGEQFPPLGWIVVDANNDGKGWLRNDGFAPTGQTAPHTGIACASLDVYAGTPGQLGYNDWLITPRMTYQDGDVFQFYIKRLADHAGQIWKILISTTGTDIADFTPIDQISDPPLSYQEKNYDLSQHGLINGDKFYIAFQFMAVWCWPGVIDDILASVVDGHQKDLMALDFTGSDIIYENATNNYQAVIGNNGHLSVASGAYTVDVCAYVNGTETTFGTAPGVDIAPGETKTIAVPVTIPTSGVYGLYSKVVWSEDEDPTNNISAILDVEVIGNSKVVKNIGTFPIHQQTPYYYLYPVNFSDWRGGSLHECLYYNNELNTGGIIERLTYYSSFANSIPQRKIKVWMTQTNKADFDASGIPASQMTLVFDGKIDFADGQGKVNILLTQPFNYTGGSNLAVMVYYYDGGNPYINDNSLFAYENLDYGPNRNLFDNWYTTIDPEDLSHVSKVPNYPLTSLMFETGNGLGSISGKVLYQDNSAPVEGARVVISNPDFPESNGVLYTDVNGDYNAPYMLAGSNLTVTISKFGYSDAVYNNINLESGASLDLGNAYLVARPHITLSGHVRTSDTGVPAALAMVKITGMEIYETTTNDEGNFEFPSIWGSTTYQMEIYYGGYQTYNRSLEVPGTNFILDTITLLENAPAPNLVHAVEQDGNALVTWYAAGAPYPIEWRRDDGVAQGVLITPGSQDIVTGSVWNYDASLTDVSWYVYPFPGYENSTHVLVTILGVNADGSPDPNNVLHQEENVPNNAGWNFCHLSQTVSAPNGFFVGISGYDNTFVLAYDDGEGEPYIWEPRTQWGNGLGAYNPLENGTSPPLRANIFIRAAGLTYGPLAKSIGIPQASYQIGIQKGKTLLACKSIEKLETGQPGMKLPVAPAFHDRSFVNYNIYRRPAADTIWQHINASPVMDTSYVDPTWNGLTYGLYKYGVEAEYTNGVKSTMSESNIMEKDMRLTLNLIVNTNTGVPGISAGALVTLTNQNGNVNYIFHAAVGAAGSVAIPNVMKGIYTLLITHVGFENYSETDIDLDIPAINFEKTVTILEHIFNPYDTEVITDGQAPQSARFLWDQAPVLDDVESYEPFLIDNIGDWKVIDQDNQPTVYPSGVTFPHMGEPSSFMSFNYLLTTPPLSVEYWGAWSGDQYFASFGSAESGTSNWLISKKQNHSLPFTLSFYAKSITENYGLETFRIGYSTSGSNTSDFVFITGNETALTYWTKFLYQIPAEAK
ncbi:MAG: choice-of-anchor J domain-containing protein, partial [Bacteroidota bacterium]